MKKANPSALCSTFLVSYLFWLLITGQLVDIFRGRASAEVLIAGVFVCLVTAAFSARFFIHRKAFFLLSGRRLGAFLAYCLGIFPAELIKANLDMAKKALSPKLKIRPGIVKIPVGLRSDYANAMLANSITLTPGTITMDIAEDTEEKQLYYYIHWIDMQTEDPKEAGEAIKGRMEAGIRRIWE